MMAIQERATCARRRAADKPVSQNPAVCALDERLVALARLAVDDFRAAVRQMSGGENPAMTDAESAAASAAAADYGLLATDLERRARAFLTQSHLSPAEERRVSDAIRCVADLHCVARAARLMSQISRLFTSAAAVSPLESAGLPVPDDVCSVGDVAADLADEAVAALASQDPREAMKAAARFRDVERKRRDAEASLRRTAGDLPPSVQRVTCALLWSVVVAAESMARVAARRAVPA